MPKGIRVGGEVKREVRMNKGKKIKENAEGEREREKKKN